MKTLRITKNLESNLRKKYLNNINTDADLVSLVGVQYDRVVVDVDSSKNDSKTVYEHDGTSWVFIAKVSDVEHELIFTEDRDIYITDKDRKLMKMGDVLPFEDIDDIVAKDPAILNKLFITKKGKIYFYNEDGEYKLVSGGGGAGGTTRLADVNAYADIATSYPKPDDYSAVVVLSDENHDGQKTWYIYEENVWNYQGIYFPETLEIKISLANTRELDILADTDYTLPLAYLVGKDHLEIYLDGELLTKDTDYVEVGTDSYMSTTIQFKNTIPIESRLMFKRVVSSYMGDSMISRMSKESWMKYFEEAYSDFDNKILTNSLKIVSAILGQPISGIIQDVSEIVKDCYYLDKDSNNIYLAKLNKTSTWITPVPSDFIIVNLFSNHQKSYKAKVTFYIGLDDSVTIVDSYNIGSVLRQSAGKFRINFSVPLDTDRFTVALANRMDEDSNENAYTARIARGYTHNINYIDIVHGHYNAGNFYNDPGIISVTIF